MKRLALVAAIGVARADCEATEARAYSADLHVYDVPGGTERLAVENGADFQSAPAWYYFVHVQNVAVPTWEVEGWVWRGMERVSSYDRQGPGVDPPASAFK